MPKSIPLMLNLRPVIVLTPAVTEVLITTFLPKKSVINITNTIAGIVIASLFML
jgi:hypothetical protein